MDAYYDVALTILDGDAGSLLALAGKLPDEAKKAELLAFHERRTREAAAAAAAAAQAQAAAAARAAALAAEAESTARRLDRVASLRPLAPIHRVDSNASIASSDRSAKTDDEHIDQLAADAADASSNDVMRELFADEDDEDCCPVCLDARVTVQCVPCSHALCGGCLELWRATNASFYAVAKNGASATATTCPMCRAPIAGFTARVASAATGRKTRDAGGAEGGAEGGAVGAGAVVARRKESRAPSSTQGAGESRVRRGRRRRRVRTGGLPRVRGLVGVPRTLWKDSRSTPERFRLRTNRRRRRRLAHRGLVQAGPEGAR